MSRWLIDSMPRATLDIDLLIQVDSLARAQQAVEPLGFWVGTAKSRLSDFARQIR